MLEIDRPKCVCGNLARPNGTSKIDGRTLFNSYCSPCARAKHGKDKNARLKRLKKDVCEECGFIPKHPCQLDVDHIDGNHHNNDPSNHKTLCANCHRLKTYLNMDYKKPLK